MIVIGLGKRLWLTKSLHTAFPHYTMLVLLSLAFSLQKISISDFSYSENQN